MPSSKKTPPETPHLQNEMGKDVTIEKLADGDVLDTINRHFIRAGRAHDEYMKEHLGAQKCKTVLVIKFTFENTMNPHTDRDGANSPTTIKPEYELKVPKPPPQQFMAYSKTADPEHLADFEDDTEHENKPVPLKNGTTGT